VSLLLAALLGLDIGILGCAASYAAHPHFADATGMHGNQQEKHQGDNVCGWIGVAVSPMTAAFAESLGMVEPYGAIFDQPEPGSPAAAANIEQGDVLTAINGSPLVRSSDFAGIISAMAPGATVYLDTRRDGQAMQVKVILGSAPCGARG
jgi:serine protease Do